MKGYHQKEVKYTCTNCNNNFPSKTVKQHISKFCSEKCKLDFGYKDANCGYCNIIIKVRKNKIRNNYFCCKICYNKWQSVNIKPPQSENRRVKANSI